MRISAFLLLVYCATTCGCASPYCEPTTVDVAETSRVVTPFRPMLVANPTLPERVSGLERDVGAIKKDLGGLKDADKSLDKKIDSLTELVKERLPQKPG